LNIPFDLAASQCVKGCERCRCSTSSKYSRDDTAHMAQHSIVPNGLYLTTLVHRPDLRDYVTRQYDMDVLRGISFLVVWWLCGIANEVMNLSSSHLSFPLRGFPLPARSSLFPHLPWAVDFIYIYIFIFICIAPCVTSSYLPVCPQKLTPVPRAASD
jgi:hypothetical protein